jgi:hypothetical protein
MAGSLHAGYMHVGMLICPYAFHVACRGVPVHESFFCLSPSNSGVPEMSLSGGIVKDMCAIIQGHCMHELGCITCVFAGDK